MENRTKQLKENFEKLEVVSEIFKNLHPTIIWFCEKELKYATSFVGFEDKVVWLNGAWYIFQELNKVKEKTKKLRNIYTDLNVREKLCLDLMRVKYFNLES